MYQAPVRASRLLVVFIELSLSHRAASECNIFTSNSITQRNLRVDGSSFLPASAGALLHLPIVTEDFRAPRAEPAPGHDITRERERYSGQNDRDSFNLKSFAQT